MFLKRPIGEPESTSLNTLNSIQSDTEIVVVGTEPGVENLINNCGGGGSMSGGFDPESSSIPPNDAVDEQKLLGNGRKCHLLPPKAPVTCKLLKKTTTRNYWKKVVIFGVILFLVIIFCMFCETFWSQWSMNNADEDGVRPNTFVSSSKSTNKLNYEPHSFADKKYHEQLVNDVNSNPKSTWKASDPQMVDKETLRLALTKNIETHDWSKAQMFADTEKQIKYLSSLSNVTLPSTFDARSQWPKCASIHQVVNQGGCGSCWAMAATSVMSDRVCVHSNSTLQPRISAQDLIECCPHCGGMARLIIIFILGCRGTVWALFSFVHWKERGIVTGGSYGSYSGCKPYEKSPSCGSPCSIDNYNAKQVGVYEVCWSVCQQLHDRSYNDDLYKAKDVYWVKPNLLNNVIYGKTMTQITQLLKKNKVDYETVIKRELLMNGPIIACFVVYDEFQHYKSGIYESMTSNHTHELYGHCAKLIGWGEENRKKYWTYMNTWGLNWGENGFFRVSIKEIPEEAAAGIPLF